MMTAEMPQHLRHPSPADTQIAGQRHPALELAGIEQRLGISGFLTDSGPRVDRRVPDMLLTPFFPRVFG
jgi:hypothetical protein